MGLLKLLSHDVNIVYTEGAEDVSPAGYMGRCNLKESRISISNSMPKDLQGSTLVHEVIHYIADLNSIELTEQSVDGLALGVFSFIHDNPELIKERILEV